MLLIYNPPTLLHPPTNVAKKNKGSDVVLSWSANSEANLNWLQTILWESNGLIYENVIDQVIFDLGNATTYTIVGGSLATEYALTAYNNITGTDDQINGFESWFTVAKDPKVSLSYTGGVLNEKSESKTLNYLRRYHATTVNLNFTGTASKESIIKLQPNKLLFQQEQ
jgi:hypothetical protein